MQLPFSFGIIAIFVLVLLLLAYVLYAWRLAALKRPLSVLALLLFGIMLFLLGPWMYLWTGFKWLLVLPVGLVFIRNNARHKAWVALDVLVAGISGFLLFTYYIGGHVPKGDRLVLNLESPFHGGKHYAMQAGNNWLTNPFHSTNKHYDIAYAVDFAGLRAGRNGSLRWKQRVTDFAIYGDSVFAPCTGKVMRVSTGNPDNEPGSINLKNGNRAGNAVFIELSEYKDKRVVVVLLAHLAPGSVNVKTGQLLTTGDFVGLVGNSGYSIEPHLHVSAALVKDNGSFTSLPLLFNSRFLNINDEL